MQNKPLIVGGSHHNTYGLVRCFGEAGMKVDCILYECRDSYVGHSKYIDKLLYCDSADAAGAKIKSLVKGSEKKRVVISATDAVASLMDLHYDEFKENCFFFNAGKAGCLTYFMDKEVQTVAAAEAGLEIPKTKAFNKGEQLQFGIFPCIIKPLASIDGGKRIATCLNAYELHLHAPEFADVERVLIQQFIEKDEEIVLLGVALNGEISIPGYIIKYRDVMGGTTYSSTAPISNIDAQLIKKAKKLIAAIRYEGLFGIELIKSGDKYYFVEVNLRNDATSYSLAVAGANLPLMYYKTCLGGLDLLEQGQDVRKIYSMVEINDFRSVLHRKIGLFAWLRQRKDAECRYLYNREDPEPYKLAKREFIDQMKKKLFG